MDGTQPWIDSDTWWSLEDGSFYNARTAAVQLDLPDGLRWDGTRRLSAETAGRWAVPFLVPPPLLSGMASQPAGLLDPGWLPGDHRPVVESWGSSGPIFTAPHSINLARDGCSDHLPEDFTSFLARCWAAESKGTSITWASAAHALCCQTEAPIPGTRDPNYLLSDEGQASIDPIRADLRSGPI